MATSGGHAESDIRKGTRCRTSEQQLAQAKYNFEATVARARCNGLYSKIADCTRCDRRRGSASDIDQARRYAEVVAPIG
jgi:hypothetical protein